MISGNSSATQRLTTSDKRPSDRIEFWQEIVCKKYVSASAATQISDDEFAGSLISRDLGPLVVAELDAPLHFWSRRPSHVRNDEQEVFIVSRLRKGGGELTQLGRTAALSGGDLVIYDSTAPFEYALRARTQLIKLPKRLLQSKLDRPEDFLGLNIDRSNPLSPVLGDLIDRTLNTDLLRKADSPAAQRLSSAIVDLLVSICDLRREAPPEPKLSLPLEKVMRFARANLDQNLTPEALAESGAISVRTLNRVFGALGVTPMRWVWSERLEASRVSLEKGQVRSVTEAAFAHGFSELAHFSRRFKRAFGHTPQELLKTQTYLGRPR